MNACIIFDVDQHHDQVVSTLKNMGYFTRWSASGKSYNLPHNLVWKPNTELATAYKDIEAVIAQLKTNNLKINLLRCLVVSSSPWVASQGVPVS